MAPVLSQIIKVVTSNRDGFPDPSVPSTVTSPIEPLLTPMMPRAATMTWPPVLMSSEPLPYRPKRRFPLLFQVEPPEIVAIPVELLWKPSSAKEFVSIAPPVTFNVPVPSKPTVSEDPMLHVEPMPLMEAVPLEPAYSPRTASPEPPLALVTFTSAPPETLRIPVP